MREEIDTPDAAIARIAARQRGFVTAEQLRNVGIDKSATSRRVKVGRLHRLHRGVYAVGHSAPSHRRRWMAAVLACGKGAVLSHHSAAALWELLRPIEGPIHVSVSTASGHSNHNIPVTSIQRTIDDLEGTVVPYLLRRARRQAELRGVRLKGAEGMRFRSDLEEEFLRLIRHLPPPETNLKLGRWEVDFLWRERKLVVEIDSVAYHRGSIAFHDDRARDLDLRQRGFTALHFTERQLEEEPDRVAPDVAAGLSCR